MTLQWTSEHHGIALPSVGIGTWPIGGPYWTDGESTGWTGPLDDDDSIRALELAIENGLWHIDTADTYGHGRSERLVGRAMAGVTTPISIASKVGFIATSAPSAFSPQNIRFQLEQTLQNLKIDSVDVYYAHHTDFGPDDIFLMPAVEELSRLKSEGLIKSIGLSGYSAPDLIRVARSLRPDFIQSWASIEHPEFVLEGEPLPTFMTENDIRFVAMMPFGQGRLLGKYDPANPPTFEDGDTRLGNEEFTAESLAKLGPRLALLKERFGDTATDLITPAIGFLLKQPAVITVIPGFRNSAQVKNIIEAVGRPYSDNDHELVNRAFPFAESHRHPWA
jgi:myo-inositol catabolism protein IolS